MNQDNPGGFRTVKLLVSAGIFVSMFLLSSCASLLATPYQPYGSGSAEGGYKDRKISSNEYYIECWGNGYSDVDQLEEYFNKRAAELAAGKAYSCEIQRFESADYIFRDPVSGTEVKFKRPLVKGTVRIK